VGFVAAGAVAVAVFVADEAVAHVDAEAVEDASRNRRAGTVQADDPDGGLSILFAAVFPGVPVSVLRDAAADVRPPTRLADDPLGGCVDVVLA